MSLAPSTDRHPTTGRDERRTLLALLAVAFVLRLAIGVPLDSSGFDTDLMQSWTRTLLAHPLDQFYAVAEGPDHLPGDLWLFWLIGHGLELFGYGNAPRGPFVAMMKLVPAIADLAIALELFALLRRFATPRAGLLTAAAYAFNPASIFLTAVWGQWDAVSMALLLGGLLVILRTAGATASPSIRHSERSEESLVAAPQSGKTVPHGRPDGRGDLVALRRSSGDPSAALRDDGGGVLRDDALEAADHKDRPYGMPGASNVPAWPLAVPLLTWAVLIKPPLALLAALFVLYGLVSTWGTAPTMRAAAARAGLSALAAGVVAVATAALLLLPFDTGLPGMPARWSLLERARFALDLYPATTLYAPNVWMLKDAHLYRPSDVDGSWLGLTERTWGTVLLALGLAWIAGVVVAWWRVAWWGRSSGSAPQVQMLVWAALALTFAAFMLPTRVHERYFFPVLVLALALAGLRTGRDGDRTARWLALGVSVTFLLTLLVGYGATSGGVRSLVGGISMAAAFRTLAAANVGLFLVTMALPLRRGWMSGHEDG